LAVGLVDVYPNGERSISIRLMQFAVSPKLLPIVKKAGSAPELLIAAYLIATIRRSNQIPQGLKLNGTINDFGTKEWHVACTHCNHDNAFGTDC